MSPITNGRVIPNGPIGANTVDVADTTSSIGAGTSSVEEAAVTGVVDAAGETLAGLMLGLGVGLTGVECGTL